MDGTHSPSDAAAAASDGDGVPQLEPGTPRASGAPASPAPPTGPLRQRTLPTVACKPWKVDLDELYDAIAETFCESTISFSTVEMPKFQRMRIVASDGNLAPKDLPGRKWVAGTGLQRTYNTCITSVHTSANKAGPLTTIAAVDGWQNTNRHEMITVGVANLPRRIGTVLLGAVGHRHCISADAPRTAEQTRTDILCRRPSSHSRRVGQQHCGTSRHPEYSVLYECDLLRPLVQWM